MRLALKLGSALLLAVIAFFAIRFAPNRLAEDVRAEVLPPPSASVPKPRPCGAVGSLAADYRPLAKDHDAPATVSELREQCADDTSANGVIHVVQTGTYAVVNCWTMKADRNGFLGEDRNIWSRAVYVGP